MECISGTRAALAEQATQQPVARAAMGQALTGKVAALAGRHSVQDRHVRRAAQEVRRMATAAGDRVLETRARRAMEGAALDSGGRAEVRALVAAMSDRGTP